jgi:multidrug resistance efflux pump
MVRKYLLPLLTVGMLLFAVYHVVRAQQTKPPAQPLVAPPEAPYANVVAGAGLVEARTENISVGAYLPGIVTKVLVKVGDLVEQNQPLFVLDDRQLKAELAYREATLAAMEAQLAKLEAMPRPEEKPTYEARVREAETNVADQEDQLQRSKTLYARRVVSEEDFIRREMAMRVARAQLDRAVADLKLLNAGAWGADKDVARASVEQARAQLKQTQTDIERLEVRALVRGKVLQVNVRPGEYVGTPPSQPLVVLGNVERYHVRVDIDEHDIPRFRPGAAAQAALRGDPRQKFPLEFVRVEPYVIPKKSLTGDNTERVDTRVLQVIYALPEGAPVYVGQQMDVFVRGVSQETSGW